LKARTRLAYDAAELEHDSRDWAQAGKVLATGKLHKAAFYDLDGTLLSCNLVTTYAYYARNDRSLFKSIYLFTKVLLSVPLLIGLDLYSRTLFNLFFFRAYRGMNRDRLIGLADDLFEVTLKPSIYAQAEELVRRTREEGYRNVLVTGALDITVRPIALHFGIQEVICNRLEFKNHVATGRVLPPLVAEEQKATIIREYARQEGIELADSCAFSDSTSDIPMLAVTGHPVATNPTRRLRRHAQRKGWPVLELKSRQAPLQPAWREERPGETTEEFEQEEAAIDIP
jgi:HAD superfamily hydrolase (TIGR01490 family)